MYLCSPEKHFLMDYNELYDKALQIAIRAHKGQKDKAGHDYILHPIRVSERCDDPRAKIVALLHDTIEDTDVTADYLREEGFTEEIVEAVLAVTRSEGEEYDDYVRRAAQNELGRMVKRADLEDNMDIRRLPELTDRDVERLRKYLRAWQYIVE
jgi:(p)ppGpp synthase/HD superfamily hydrolase